MSGDRGYTHPEYLTDTDALEHGLDDPALRVFDCTVHLVPDPERGFREENARGGWVEGHVPGCDFIDLPKELCDERSSLPFTAAPPERIAETLSRHGVDKTSRVVLYSREDLMWAARVWWLLRAVGIETVTLLDGGFDKWRREGRPISTEPCRYPPARFVAQPRPELFADSARVLHAVGDGGSCLINALPASSHRGEGMSYGSRPGRIASSVNAPFPKLVDRESGTFRSATELSALFESIGTTRERAAITYCGAGIAASSVAFALLLIGHPDVALYDGSLSEWAADPKNPMETG